MFGPVFTDVFFLILLQQVRKPPLLVFRFQKGSLGRQPERGSLMIHGVLCELWWFMGAARPYSCIPDGIREFDAHSAGTSVFFTIILYRPLHHSVLCELGRFMGTAFSMGSVG